MRFKDKVALVTGGNRGIGKAIAKKFVGEGARVAIIGRDKEALKDAEQELGDLCKGYRIDLTSLDQIKKGLHKIHEDLGSFDTLILNAGIDRSKETLELSEEDYDSMMNTNVKGPYFFLQKALPYLKDGSSVVAISSIAAHLSIAARGVYAASKAALNSLMQAFSAEFLEKRKIRFNILSPGYTRTSIFDERVKQDSQFIEKSSRIVPLKRMGEPSEVANCALFFASDEASFVSGAKSCGRWGN